MFRQAITGACVALLACGPALAMDARDEGTYVMLNRQGQATTQVFRVLRKDGDWALEDRRPDGSWADVTCSEGCRLSVSRPDDIRRFFPPDVLATITPECVHNKAFAFCGYAAKSDAASRGHLLVALVRAPYVPIRLSRVDPE